MSEKQTIVLGVTGGIAAYKAADLCSRLVRSGFDVHVIMTQNAQAFITAQTFMTLSKRRVITGLFDMADYRPEHVALADLADLLVVAPCTANFIGKFAHGIADDALTTFAVTHHRKVLLAPAMNPAMWGNGAVQANVSLLRSRDIAFVGPETGHVACGPDGAGRMSEPETILTAIRSMLSK